MAKHDEAELELLGNLLNFMRKKHESKSISDIEKLFGKAARELETIGEISNTSLETFCDLEGLEVPTKKKVTPSSTKSSSSYGGRNSSGDGCGGGGSYRSSC